jgi:hypothetical protein
MSTITEPILRDWITVNNVYYKGEREQYGYVVRNRHTGEERRISTKTASKMMIKGLLEFGFVSSVVTNKKKGLVHVPEGFREDLSGIDLGE